MRFHRIARTLPVLLPLLSAVAHAQSGAENYPARPVRIEFLGDLVESIRLFDVYEGQQVGEGPKSLAFALRFRAPDRTLSAEETAAAREAALASAAARVGATLRT